MNYIGINQGFSEPTMTASSLVQTRIDPVPNDRAAAEAGIGTSRARSPKVA